jgi:tRNA G18 (ribose-2'-O)-methylase SpoU
VSGPDPTDIFTHTGDPAWLLNHGLFVAEGRHVTRRLLATPRFETVALLLTPTAEAALGDVLGSALEAGVTVDVRSQAELDALTGFRLHQGCVAFARRRPLPACEPASWGAGLSVLLERVRDPDNVGSIMRSASGMGVQRVIIGPECADPFYRKAIRTSMGAVLTLDVCEARPWPGVLDACRDAGQTLVATTPDPRAPLLDEVAARLHGGVILLVGSEGEGLTAQARAAAQLEARIPMVGAVDSLNVAVAAAVAVYAVTRGRGHDK